MSQYYQIHPENPQKRLVGHAVEIIQRGGVVIFPTDTSYSIGCHIGDKASLARIRQIRGLDEKHLFTLICKDLSELGLYARVDNQAFRQLKAHTPGPFTFLLEATKEVPRRLHNGKRKQVGMRVPQNQICLDLLAALGEPMVASTLILPGESLPMNEPWEIRERLEHQVDLIIDGGYVGIEQSTVIDMSGTAPELIRQGVGDFSDFAPV